MSEVVARLEEAFGPEAVADFLSRALPELIVALVSFAAIYLGMWGVRRLAGAAVVRSGADPMAGQFVDRILNYAGIIVGLLVALEQTGVDTRSLITSLGIVGFAIGFAAQDALSNVISGLFIFWDRPFVVGDLVEVEGHYGRVAEITVRTTRLVTPDGKMLAIPNKTMVNSTVASYTNFPHLRTDIDVTVGVDENLGRVRQLLLEIVTGDPAYLPEPQPRVVVTALNDYNVALQLQAWIEDEQSHVAASVELRERVLETLRAHDIEMPFETLALAPIQIQERRGPADGVV